MLAHLQQGIVAALLLLCGAWLWWSRDLPGWVIVGGVLLLSLAHAVFLAFEFAFAQWINRHDLAPRATWRMLALAWLRESVLAPQVFLWRQPFCSNAWPDRLGVAGAAATGRTGVVFIHGFVCNRGLWNPWLAQLHQSATVFVAVNLEPVFGSIDDYAALIDAAVRRVEKATGAPVLLVCHSMGGLVARVWLRQYQADARVQHVVTIGTPHGGTALAQHSYVSNGRQMAVGSAWLEQLRRDESPARASLFTCYYSSCDNIVFPSTSATLDGAQNIFLAGVPHVAMAFAPEVIDAVRERLDAPAAPGV
ncbi:MAG: alpha/beta fold hydrolase [Rhodoferax sp.]|nr:alpha/beta fold hydrolase [Rhodoferax sp.]